MLVVFERYSPISLCFFFLLISVFLHHSRRKSFSPVKMMFRSNHRYFSSFLIIILVSYGRTETIGPTANTTIEPAGETTRISLAQFNSTNTDGQAFYDRTKLAPNSENFVELYDIPKDAAFVIIQIHTHEINVTMSYDDLANCVVSSNCSLYGTNIGLEIRLDGNSTARVVVSNGENATVDGLIAAVAYTSNAPIPGGCNLEFDIEVSPYQKLRYNEATVTVEAQPASAPSVVGTACGKRTLPVKLTAYRMYLPEREFTTEAYFDGIEKMLTVKNIVENGQKILPALGASPIRRVYSAYPGTGSIYAMIATHGNYSSAYVPAATYACRPLTSSSSSCGNLNTTVAKALCAIVLIVGLVITFVGHKCLGFEVVFLGAICGGIISFSVLTAIGYFETSTILGIVMAVGFLSGIGCLVLSFCAGMPLVATFLASMTLGFFVASTIYFGIADDTPLFESDVNFWLIYTGVTLLVPIVLAVLPFSSNVVSCAILGAYSIILPIDYYAGSNLKYIVINTVRRATVAEFNVAVVQPPYQGTDKCLVAFLIITALLGIYVQVGKVFCCPCGRQRRTTVYWGEREPVLSAPRSGRRVLVFGEHDRVDRSDW